MTNSVIAVIPARYSSTRLPGKPLAEIDGVPMIVRVWRQASLSHSIDRVIVATDHDRVASVIRAAGGEAIMTCSDHPSGTDRIAEVARSLEAQIFINVQGDLPFIAPADLDALAGKILSEPGLAMATLATPINEEQEWRNPNIVKLVRDYRGDALYFSRGPIPFDRDRAFPSNALRHIGVYGYRRDILLRFAAFPPGVLEQVERLEQLRVLERGLKIRVVDSVAPSLEIDTPEDLARANDLARAKTGAQALKTGAGRRRV
jgi:3-deoxy-D-manno-octulosonate cytidylyltransferase